MIYKIWSYQLIRTFSSKRSRTWHASSMKRAA